MKIARIKINGKAYRPKQLKVLVEKAIENAFNPRARIERAEWIARAEALIKALSAYEKEE